MSDSTSSPSADGMYRQRLTDIAAKLGRVATFMHLCAQMGVDVDASLTGWVEDFAKVAPHLDNHHNAALCPYCRPQSARLASPPSERSDDAGIRHLASAFRKLLTEEQRDTLTGWLNPHAALDEFVAFLRAARPSESDDDERQRKFDSWYALPCARCGGKRNYRASGEFQVVCFKCASPQSDEITALRAARDRLREVLETTLPIVRDMTPYLGRRRKDALLDEIEATLAALTTMSEPL